MRKRFQLDLWGRWGLWASDTKRCAESDVSDDYGKADTPKGVRKARKNLLLRHEEAVTWIKSHHGTHAMRRAVAP